MLLFLTVCLWCRKRLGYILAENINNYYCWKFSLLDNYRDNFRAIVILYLRTTNFLNNELLEQISWTMREPIGANSDNSPCICYLFNALNTLSYDFLSHGRVVFGNILKVIHCRVQWGSLFKVQKGETLQRVPNHQKHLYIFTVGNRAIFFSYSRYEN